MDINKLEDRARYLGNDLQMYGAERMEYAEGKNKGSSFYDVRTGGGLLYKVMADNALDIGELYYKGQNIHYLSKNGHQSPHDFHPFGSDFFYTFPAGMLFTCGLMSAGDGNDDGGFWHPIHGRVHYIPATECSSLTDGGKIEIKGKIIESRYNGHVLRLERTVSSPVGGASIILHDRVMNCTPQDEEYMIVYHFNFGYPFLSPELAIEVPDGSSISARSPWAEKNLGGEFDFTEPSDGCEDGVFFHNIPAEGGMSKIRLLNKKLKIGAELKWSSDTLPNLAEWKCMRSGEYVLGIEPTNSFIMGRSAERANGTIGKIGAFETKEMIVELSFFDI